MSETIYIHDAFGKSIRMLDENGNITLEAVMLYSEDKLTEADRNIVDAFAENDEMTRDALDGFTITGNPSKTRYTLGQLNNEIVEKTGAVPLPSTKYDEKKFNFRRIAATIALLMVVGGGTFFIAQYLGSNELADSTTTETIPSKAERPALAEPPKNEREPVYSDSMLAEYANDAIVANKDHMDVMENRGQMDEKSGETNHMAGAALVREKVELAVIPEPEKPQEPSALEASDDFNDQEVVQEAAFNDRASSGTKLEDEKNNSTKVETIADLISFKLTTSEEESSGNSDTESANEAVDSRMQEEALIALETKRKVSAEEEKASKSAENMAMKEAKKAEQNRLANAELAQQARTSALMVQDNAMRAADEVAVIEEPKLSVDAKYPGGDIAMYKFIHKEKNYTDAMRAQELKGIVIVTFDIEKDGRVANSKIKTGVTGLLDEDALRVIRSMPNWQPAVQGGNFVKSSKTVVIKYGE